MGGPDLVIDKYDFLPADLQWHTRFPFHNHAGNQSHAVLPHPDPVGREIAAISRQELAAQHRDSLAG